MRLEIQKLKRFCEEVYFTLAGKTAKMYIYNKDYPETFFGYFETKKHYLAEHLFIGLQKIGLDCSVSKPKYCEYARGVPTRLSDNKSFYIEFAEFNSCEGITEAITTALKNAGLEAQRVNCNPFKD